MDIIKENKDELNAVIKVKVQPEDYKEEVDKQIKDYKKKVKMDGFRPGKVPEGLVRKMYGTSLKIDHINKLISEKLGQYLKDEELKILGEPLPSKEEQKEVNWEQDKEFEFAFDVGLSPEFEVKISKQDKIPFYKIKVTDDLINQQIENYQSRLGDFQDIEQVETNEELIKADISQLDENKNIKENGIQKENATISLNVIKDEEEKKKFKEAKVGDEIDIQLKKAYPSAAELSSMLGISKEEAEEVDGFFRVKINEIKKFVKAEINQDFFDKLYGEGKVNSEEEMKEKIKEELEKQLEPESDKKFAQDAREHFVNKINPELPSEFLKRWLKETQKDNKLTEEQIENEFPDFLKDVQWDLIKNKIIKEYEIKVEESEVLDLAKQYTLQQFQQYGMMNLPEEQLEQYAQEILKKEEDKNKLYDQKYQDKVIELLKEMVKLNEKEVTSEEFKEQIEKDQDKQSKK